MRAPGRGADVSKVNVWAAAPASGPGKTIMLDLDIDKSNNVLLSNIVPENTESDSLYEQGS